MAKVFDPKKYKKQTPEYYQTEKPVLVLMKGGTIDAQSYMHTKQYQLNGEAPKYIKSLKLSVVPKALRESGHGSRCSFLQLKMNDSQKLIKDKKDRKHVADLIRSVDQPVIVMTFGTDAMADMAKYMADQLEGSGKTLILTGAMEPLEHGKHTDGYANLDFAVRVGLSRQLKPGAYVAMKDFDNQPQIFKPDEVVKVREKQPDGRIKKFFCGHPVTLDLSAITPVLQR